MMSDIPIKNKSSFGEFRYACNSNGSMILMEEQRRRQRKTSTSRTRRSQGLSEMAADLGFIVETLFCKYTSAHGFKCAVSPERHKIVRLLWVVAIIVSVSSLTWASLELRGNYYNYPQTTLVDVKYVSELPFPSVTLCNLHAYEYRKADLLHNVTDAAVKLYNIHLAESITTEKNVEDFLSDPEYNDIMDQQFSAIYSLLGMNISDTFKYCAWNGARVHCEDIFKTVHTMDGLCYQFNYNSSYPMSTSQVGPSTGLSVLVSQAGHDVDPVMLSGLKVLLHNPGNYPDIVTQGFLVPLGFTTFGRIYIRQAVHLSHPYKSYGDNYCLTNENMAGDTIYSRDSCIASCAYNLAARTCNCSINYEDETTRGRQQCTLRQALSCIRPTFANALLEASASNNTCASCRYKCDVTTFSMTTSQATFPLRAEQRSNYLELRLFYDHLTKEVIKYEPEYTWHAMLGIVGGYMGIFIGASVLTICEVIECIIFAVHRLFQKGFRRSKPQKELTKEDHDISSD